METTFNQRALIHSLGQLIDQEVLLRGWIYGRVRADHRSRSGYEVDVIRAGVLSRSATGLPFNSSSNIESVGQETLLEYRPLAVRNDAIGDVFRIQAAALKYFDRVAYLAQSPQFYKEHGVAGFERVYETGHVYRAEPHASSRHLTEYYSLDFEVGFIDGPEDVVQIERELLTYMFNRLMYEHGDILRQYRIQSLPSMLDVPTWEFSRCLELLKEHFGRTDLRDDLDPEGERQLCALA